MDGQAKGSSRESMFWYRRALAREQRQQNALLKIQRTVHNRVGMASRWISIASVMTTGFALMFCSCTPKTSPHHQKQQHTNGCHLVSLACKCAPSIWGSVGHLEAASGHHTGSQRAPGWQSAIRTQPLLGR